MGKDSLIKSTSSKKTAAKKKSAAPKKAAAKPKAAKKKTAAKKKSAAKPKAAKKKTAAKKKSVKKQITIKDLLKKQYGTWKPEVLYSVSPDGQSSEGYTAPAFILTSDQKETDRIRKLLFKKFDLSAPQDTPDTPEKENLPVKQVKNTPPPVKDQPQQEPDVSKPADAQEDQPQVIVSYDAPSVLEKADPMDRMIKIAYAGIALVFSILIIASSMNTGNYYIKEKAGSLEIRQGRFAPMGEKILILLPGVEAPAKAKDIYPKEEVYPLIFNYYVEKSDTLLDVRGIPDFSGIKAYLNKAIPYGTTDSLRKKAQNRLNSINLKLLHYKAEVAESKGGIDNLETAAKYLAESAAFDLNKDKARLIEKKIQGIQSRIELLKAKKLKAQKRSTIK